MSRDSRVTGAATKSPRFAIIGCGKAVEHVIVPGLRRIGWLPSALVDVSSERLDAISTRFGRDGPSMTKSSDWRSVADTFDMALVVLPIGSRHSTAVQLMEAGKHVFLEMPLALDDDECLSMNATASRCRVMLSVGLYWRFRWIVGWTRALLQSGTLGSIQRFDIGQGRLSGLASGLDDLLPAVAPDGTLLDGAAHVLDLLHHWLGNVEDIDYRDDGEDGGIEAECVLSCRLASGATGNVEISRARRLRDSFRIEGTLGYVEVGLRKDEVLAGSPNALSFRWGKEGLADRPHQSFDELVGAALNDFRKGEVEAEQVGGTASEGQRTVHLIERCRIGRRRLALPWMTVLPHQDPDVAENLCKLPVGSKILVTGATGFVGGRLVERLLELGHTRITCLIRDPEKAVRLRRQPVEVLVADLADPEDVNRAFGDVSYVFHCAYDLRSRRQNTGGLRNLLDACAAHSVSRFVHVSTFAVYEPFPDGPLGEDTRDGDRSNVYVDTKLSLEKQVFEAAERLGIPATIIQPAIVYGPFCYPWTIAPAEMLIFGDVILPDAGDGFCNAVYIDDLVDSMILAAVSPEALGERFIISGPEPVTWRSFFDEFARTLGTASAKFWPREQIAKSNRGVLPQFRQVVSFPKSVVKSVVRWQPVRSALLAACDVLPPRVRKSLLAVYSGSSSRRRGQEIVVPNQQVLALYTSKARAGSEKARSKLGYRPQFDFQRGMQVTGEYLQWAYRDQLQSVREIQVKTEADDMSDSVQPSKSFISPS